MATSKEFRDYILERLDTLDGIFCRPMMGEYLLYLNGVLFGGIYDERLLIKAIKTDFGLEKEIPYKGAKPMLRIKDLDNKAKIKSIIEQTCEELDKSRRNK